MVAEELGKAIDVMVAEELGKANRPAGCALESVIHDLLRLGLLLERAHLLSERRDLLAIFAESLRRLSVAHLRLREIR
jgi:hypothetical protein